MDPKGNGTEVAKSSVWGVVAMLTLALHSVFIRNGEKDEIRKMIRKLEGQAMVGR